MSGYLDFKNFQIEQLYISMKIVFSFQVPECLPYLYVVSDVIYVLKRGFVDHINCVLGRIETAAYAIIPE